MVPATHSCVPPGHGGIEVNPSPIYSELCAYEKTKGFADMTGELYEIKLSALIFLRAVQTEQPFQLASNMKAAGCFDDIVLTLGDITMFMQLKHKAKSDIILKLSDLTRDKQFNLPKYLKSYLDIKQHWQDNPDLQYCGMFDDVKFVIFTNAKVDENLVNAAGSAELLNVISTGGTCKCLTELFQNLPKYNAVLSAAVSTENVTASPELWEVVHKLYSKQAQSLPSKRQLEEILEHLESLGDFTCYQQFISQLYLCAGQMAEKDLDDLIRREICYCCGTESRIREFMDGVQDWWKNSNCHLTVKAKFFQDIIQEIVANISKDISTLKVRFVESECDTIRQKLISGNRKIYLKTECTSLSCIKVLQSFKKSILVDVDTFQTHQSEVLAIWRLGVCHLLVVEGETVDISILQKLATNMSDSKCVVVISVNEQPQLYQEFKFSSFIDSFCLNQLEFDSQCAVMEHEIIFQGFPVKLNSLTDDIFLQSAVTADTVVQLHNTLHIGHRLDDLDSCYIPRTFLRKEYITKHILREKEINLAITGKSKGRLAPLLPIGEKVQKFHRSKFTLSGNCRYFLIEGESDFTALCSMKNNIHWIEACEDIFLWKKSKGDMSLIIEHLEEKYVSYADTDELLSLLDQVVLLDGKPGMGKSTEMCNIAHTIKQKDPSTWVIRVDLNKHTTLLSQNQIDALEFLATVATLNTEFQKQLFEYQLQSGGNIVILLDGFDEVSPNYSTQVFDLLTKLSDSIIKKIFVTSRPIMIKELQDKLSILAFSFHAFTADDRENFLIRHWNQTVESLNLSNFIPSLLELVEASLNDKLKEFTGIPLQCKMMAEVFRDEALHYCQTGEVRLPQSLNMLQLYDKFIEKKWQVYCKKLHLDLTNAMQQISIENQKFQYQQNVMCCALVSYLHDDVIRRLHNSEYILKQNQEFVEMFKKGQDKSGIVNDIVNNKTVFVHQTFTEYFIAMWFFEHLNFELHNIKDLYFDKKFDVVRGFLDRMLAQEMKLHTAVLNENLVEIKNMLTEHDADINKKDGGGRTALHLAIMNYFNTNNKINNSIIETLLEHGADVNCEDKVLHWRPLRLAEEIRAWYVVDKLLEKQVISKDLILIKTDIKKQLCIQNPVQMARRRGLRQCMISVMNLLVRVECMNGFLAEVIYTALSEGYVNLVEFILKYRVSVRHYIYHRHKTSMLHVAAEHRQLRLVQMLVEQGAYIDDKTCWYNRTPLMQAVVYGHVQVAEFLINRGASVNERDEYGDTALLLASRKGQNEIVELLLQKGADVEICDCLFNRTPIMQAAKYNHLQIVGLLINSGAFVNARDGFGYTALLLAAHEGQTEIVELLLQNGADVEIYDVLYNKTPLMKTAERGHVKIAELLINHGASINARDKDGDTALQLAGHKDQTEIMKLLLLKGADTEISGGVLNRTSLMKAAECAHVQLAELLINHGASVNARDKYGNTALSLALTNNHNNIVQLLLQHGAQK